jgi:hypothetical protein
VFLEKESPVDWKSRASLLTERSVAVLRNQ